MTPEEAIQELKIIKSNIASYECNTPQCKVKRWPEVTYNALNMAIDALEKQIPKKIIPADVEELAERGWYMCPVCRTLEYYAYNSKYCDDCGQRLDWSEVDK